jgi:hypothetical protein
MTPSVERRYDIVRKESEKAIFWLEGTPELALAESRVAELMAFWPGEYQIFDLRTKRVIDTTASAPNSSALLPLSNPAE